MVYFILWGISVAPEILVIADNIEFVEAMKADEQCKNHMVHYVSALDHAKIILSDSKKKFNCIFIDPEISEGAGVSLIRNCHSYQAAVPIYLILDDLKKLGEAITEKNIGIQGLLKGPAEMVAIAKIIENGMKQFDFQKAIDANKAIKDPEEDSSDGTLVGIKAANFLSGSKSFFDVFVRLSKTKFVKILDAGEGFEPGRLNRYMDKGLEYLYIKKDAQKFYLEFCDKLTANIIKSNKISAAVKISQTLNQGHEVAGFLQKNGLDAESLAYATNYSNNVTALIKNVGENDKTLKAFMQNIASFEHCAGTAMLAGLLARKMGYEGNEIITVLGVAATLHDIGLYKITNVYDNFDPEHDYYDEDEIEHELKNKGIAESRRRMILKAYSEHPVRGAEIVSKISGIDKLVAPLISQHHERINGTGFPGLVKSQMLNPLSQIIGVSDEFTKLIKRIGNLKANKDELLTFPSKLDGFSGAVRRAWESQFLKK